MEELIKVVGRVSDPEIIAISKELYHSGPSQVSVHFLSLTKTSNKIAMSITSII